MTMRVDSNQLIAGRCVVTQYPGHGIKVQDIPSTGESGPAALYNDAIALGALPTDEMRWQILAVPASGVFTPYESSEFTLVGASDGVHYATYLGFINGAPYLNPETDEGEWIITMTIGDTATQSTISYDIGAVTFSAELTVSVPVAESTVSYDIGAVEWSVSASVAYAGNAMSISYDIGAVAYSVSATATPPDNLINISYDIGSVTFATSMNVIAAPSDIGLTVNYDIGAISYNVAIISGSSESLYGIGSGVIFIEPTSGVLFSN